MKAAASPSIAPAAVEAAAAARTRRLRSLRRGLLIGLLVAGGILMMIPFLWMITTSLKTRAEVFAIPPTILPRVAQWSNYPDMWNALPFDMFFLNSVKIAALNTIGQLISCSMAAFAFAALRFRYREPLFALLLVTLIIPFQVVLVPNFILYRFLPHPGSASGNWIGTQEPLWVGAFLGGQQYRTEEETNGIDIAIGE